MSCYTYNNNKKKVAWHIQMPSGGCWIRFLVRDFIFNNVYMCVSLGMGTGELEDIRSYGAGVTGSYSATFSFKYFLLFENRL